MNKRTLLALTALIAAAVSFNASAAPTPVTKGVATYLSGGIGLDESTLIQQEAKNYPLELEFLIKASPKDEYAADIHVKISDASNNVVLDAVSKGPFFLAKLPAGNYHLEAAKNGQVKDRKIAITPGSHQHIMFEWRE
ncbi:MAG: carboxypeptidase regulatory-like domain-containing protein [Collimonas sp.]|uniref:carboxypeptidase regulatory-like domain-containing protein n=1 Tax=Collimonas sp. TaxID=1963772 RepID=UPI003262CD2D